MLSYITASTALYVATLSYLQKDYRDKYLSFHDTCVVITSKTRILEAYDIAI